MRGQSNTLGISVAHHGGGVWARGGELGQLPFRPGREVAMLPEWILGLFLSRKLSKPISLPSSPELISTHSLCQLNVASDRNKHQISLCEKANYYYISGTRIKINKWSIKTISLIIEHLFRCFKHFLQ